MNKSESIKELAIALSKFQGKVVNPKNTADNPFYKSKYAPLGEVINTAKPILAESGLSVLQNTSSDGSSVTITTLLLHESGEWIESDPLILKAEKATPQGQGSAITYGRRYQLSAILGLSSEEDDDGNNAEPKKQPQNNKSSGNDGNKSKDNKAAYEKISADHAKHLFTIAKGDTKEAQAESVKMVIEKYGYKNTKDISTADYKQICEDIENMPF